MEEGNDGGAQESGAVDEGRGRAASTSTANGRAAHWVRGAARWSIQIDGWRGAVLRRRARHIDAGERRCGEEGERETDRCGRAEALNSCEYGGGGVRIVGKGAAVAPIPLGIRVRFQYQFLNHPNNWYYLYPMPILNSGVYSLASSPGKKLGMASVTARAPVAALRPSTASLKSSSAFLGHSSRLARAAAPTRRSLKAEAKGEWLPGLASPAYLDGSLPGDNGFDPLGLAEDPENLRWFVQAELVNGRWAMLGVAGMLIPEVLTKAGLINAPQWYDAGKSEYFASSSTLFVIEFILFHYVEIRRWQDIKNPGSVNQDPIFKSYSLPPHECGYPGSVFNPLNFAPTLEAKEKELANGRLAMLAFLGFLIQHNVTGKGPFDNLLQHLSDPWHNTIIQTFSS